MSGGPAKSRAGNTTVVATSSAMVARRRVSGFMVISPRLSFGFGELDAARASGVGWLIFFLRREKIHQTEFAAPSREHVRVSRDDARARHPRGRRVIARELVEDFAAFVDRGTREQMPERDGILRSRVRE